MIPDGSKEQSKPQTTGVITLRKNNISGVHSPPYRKNYNPVETVIRELRKKWCGSVFWFGGVFRTNCPRKIVDFGIPYLAKIMHITASLPTELSEKPLQILVNELQQKERQLNRDAADKKRVGRQLLSYEEYQPTTKKRRLGETTSESDGAANETLLPSTANPNLNC